MSICPNCDYENDPGTSYCENCGASLLETRNIRDTQIIEAQLDDELDAIPDPTHAEQFYDHYMLSMQLLLTNNIEQISVSPIDGLVLGREIAKTTDLPFVDFAHYEGYQRGISRHHAKMMIGDDHYLYLVDLGSSNGTYLNNRRLTPQLPYRVYSGDVMHLGTLEIVLSFQ